MLTLGSGRASRSRRGRHATRRSVPRPFEVSPGSGRTGRDGFWDASSANLRRKDDDTFPRFFIRDAASGYAVLALSEAEADFARFAGAVRAAVAEAAPDAMEPSIKVLTSVRAVTVADVCPTCGRPKDLVRICGQCGARFVLSLSHQLWLRSKRLALPSR